MKTMNNNFRKLAAPKFTMKSCLGACRKVVAQMKKVKDAIFVESRGMLQAHEQLLRLTLNEAEALAWQTSYPHLVFPTLASEKVKAVVAWNDRQRSVRGLRDRLAA